MEEWKRKSLSRGNGANKLGIAESYSRRTWEPRSDISSSQTALATACRVPLLTTDNPYWSYITGIVVEDVTSHVGTALMPTDDEVRMVGCFLDEYCNRWYHNHFRAVMARFAPYDIDDNANLAVFRKRGPRDWCYTKRTWETPWHPAPSEESLSLVELLDHYHTIAGQPDDRWLAWKDAHPQVFDC